MNALETAKAALLEAVRLIEFYHGPSEWETYYEHSPEMKRLRAALAFLGQREIWHRWTDMDGYERITSSLPSVDHAHPDSAVVPFAPLSLAPNQRVVTVEQLRLLLRLATDLMPHSRAAFEAIIGDAP